MEGTNMHASDEILLVRVLEVAGDNEKMIRDGVIKALYGINDPARRTYLFGELSRKATKKIRAARRKFDHSTQN